MKSFKSDMVSAHRSSTKEEIFSVSCIPGGSKTDGTEAPFFDIGMQAGRRIINNYKLAIPWKRSGGS